MFKKLATFTWFIGAVASLATSSAKAESTGAWPWSNSYYSNAQSMYVEGYEPTVLEDEAAAVRLYSSMRPNTDFNPGIFGGRWGAQCFHRATVWATEMERYNRVKSLKVALWYSPWYYSWYKEKKARPIIGITWVFHIAPAVLVGPEREIYVMDKGFTFIDKPLKLQDWAHEFLDEPYVRDCRIVKSAAEFESIKNSMREPCALHVVPMYYHHPYDWYDMETKRDVLRSFRTQELKWSFESLRSR